MSEEATEGSPRSHSDFHFFEKTTSEKPDPCGNAQSNYVGGNLLCILKEFKRIISFYIIILKSFCFVRNNMKRIALIFALLTILCCKDDSTIESKIAKIDTNFTIERFDKVFAAAKPTDLPKLKQTFPFMFSKRYADSVWRNRMTDTLQQQLFGAVGDEFENFDDVNEDINQLFQHLKYYDKTFKEPRVITVTSDVDYRHKTIVTDTIVFIALDTYLGENHEFYSGIQGYLKQNFTRNQIVVDLASEYFEKYNFQRQQKTLLDEMIYFGKQLYFKDIMIPFKTDAEKIGYAQQQFDWAVANESEIWRYFIERELLFSTDSDLPGRFINPAPFSKFYLELDNESPGRLGQFIGWQIVRAYMNNNDDVLLMQMLQKSTDEIFNNSKFKPQK